MRGSGQCIGRLGAALAAAGALCGTGAGVRAQEPASIEASYGAAKLIVGAFGQVETTGEAATVQDDLSPSWGAGLQYMARVHRHFAVGAQLALHSWQSRSDSDADRDRNLAIDGIAVPAFVLPINRDTELYLSAGLGFSMNRLGDATLALEVAGVDSSPPVPIDVDESIHFVLQPAVGARLALAQGFGVLAELGYALRWYEHELRLWIDSARDAAIGVPVELSLGQLTLALGVFF